MDAQVGAHNGGWQLRIQSNEIRRLMPDSLRRTKSSNSRFFAACYFTSLLVERSGAVAIRLRNELVGTATMAIDRDDIKKTIADECKATKRSTKLWSLLHYGLSFSAIALSAAAASVLNLNHLFSLSSELRHDYATLFSTIAAVFGSIAVAGNFASKWSASRMARSGLEQLRYQLLDTSCDLTAVLARLCQIRRDKDIAFTQQVGRTSAQQLPASFEAAQNAPVAPQPENSKPIPISDKRAS